MALVDRAGEAMVRGIERRSARVALPGWVVPLLALRGLLPAVDRRLLHDEHVRAAIARAEQPRPEDGGEVATPPAFG